jgi:signal transduction histidine kinase
VARLLLPRALGRLPATDAALAAALMVLAVGGLVSGQVHERPLAVTLPVAVVSTAAIAVRTRLPVTVACVISALAVGQAVLAGSSSQTLWSLVVFLVGTYTVAAECDEGPALVGLGAVLGSQFLCEWLDHGSDYPFDTLVFGGVWLFGRGTRSWRNQATYAERHRHDLARIAVAEERTRIARELHDVVAHSLSVIAVQADAAEAALLKEPARAAQPMRAIRDSARAALDDMRQLLHVLRTEDDAGAAGDLAPARGLDDLPQLVATMREAGLPLQADLEPVGTLSAGTELAAFRIAQEGLTNVRKHAGDVPTSLRLFRAADALRLEIHNAAPVGARVDRGAPSTGHGLVGVRERVHAAGGTLRAGPTPEGGFSVVASLPIAAQERHR